MHREPRQCGAALPALESGVVCIGQGISAHTAIRVPKAASSGRPFPATRVHVPQEARLRSKFTSANDVARKYIIEANGTGVAFFDYDGDGRQDVFLVNGSRLEGFADGKAPTNHLYRNEGSGKFTNVTREAGMIRSGWGNGVCTGDIDNDGSEDLYLTYWGKNALYRNDGHGKFADIASKSGVEGSGTEWSSGCTFFDYDRDGHLDLLVTSYQKFDLKTA